MQLLSNKEIDGKQVQLFTLKNASGIVVQITNYGGRIVSLWTPDKQGNFRGHCIGLRFHRPIPKIERNLFWSAHWSLWKPHSERQIYSEWY